MGSDRVATVVGRGPSGLFATALLVAGGVSVHLAASAAGSLPLWSGRMDFRNWEDAQPVGDPWRWWSTHGAPHFVGAGNVDRWAQVWALWGALTRRLGLQAEVPDRNRWTATVMGRTRPVFWVPPWEMALELDEALRMPVALVALDGLVDFDADPVADAFPDGASVEACRLPKPPGWNPAWGAVRYAAYFDTAPGAEWLGQRLAAAVGPRAASLIVMPQVLRLERTDALWRRLEGLVGRPVREVALPPPGVGGMRLERRWVRWLLSSGVHLHQGRVEARDPTGGVRMAGESAPGP